MLEQLTNRSSQETVGFQQSYPDTTVVESGDDTLLDSNITGRVIYSSQELADYSSELKSILDKLGSNKDTLYYKTERRLEMANRGWMAFGLDSSKAQEQLHILFGEFGNSFYGVERECEFNATQESVDESRKLLQQLPFVSQRELIKHSTTDRLIIDGKIDVPLDAVIGAEGIASWAGRGENQLKNGKPSIEVIREYASKGKYDGSQWMLDARVVRGSDGKSYLYLDSSHRAAAAKLRGDKSIIVDSITLTSEPWEIVLN